MRKRSRVACTCLYCGERFETFPSEIKKGHGKFCSRKCAMTHRNIHDNPTKSEAVRRKISKNHADVSGERNPMYMRRGKLAPSYIDGRSYFPGEQYRKILLASGTKAVCCVCGSTENLHVHHIDGNHANNDIKNLAWVCAHCHLTIVHEYQKNEKGQFAGMVTHELKLNPEKE